MKKVKIELTVNTFNDKTAKIVLYAEADESIIGESVRYVAPPIVSIVDTPETAAGQDAGK